MISIPDILMSPEPGEKLAPVHQSTVYVIMWKSSRSNGTYSEIRKSWEGMRNFILTLDTLGFDLSLVTVFEQEKPWVPVRKSKVSKRRQPEGGVNIDEQVHAGNEPGANGTR